MKKTLGNFFTVLAFTVMIGCGGLTGSSGNNIGVPSGTILIADEGNGRIVAMDDMTGAGWRTYGFGGNGVGMFDPQDIETGPDGKIYIADGINNRIVRIDNMNGDGWTTVPAINPTTDLPDFVGMLMLDASGAIFYVSGNSIVRIDDMTGAGMTVLDVDPGSTGFYVGEFDFDSTGRIIALGSRIVRRFDDMSGANPVEFEHPYNSSPPTPRFADITVDSQNRLLISDDVEGILFRFDDMTGTTWIEDEIGGGRDIHVTQDGRFYSYEYWGLTMRNTVPGSVVHRIGTIGSGKYQFYGYGNGVFEVP